MSEALAALALTRGCELVSSSETRFVLAWTRGEPRTSRTPQILLWKAPIRGSWICSVKVGILRHRLLEMPLIQTDQEDPDYREEVPVTDVFLEIIDHLESNYVSSMRENGLFLSPLPSDHVRDHCDAFAYEMQALLERYRLDALVLLTDQGE